MKRRDFVKLAGAAALGLNRPHLLVGQGAPPAPAMPHDPPANANSPDGSKADFTLRIAPVTVELNARSHAQHVGYNGTSPGPLLRMKEGVPTTVEVINDTDVPEFVHWHGLFIPAEADGVEEEGTPFVPPHGRPVQFTPRPAGTRWYHSHTMAVDDLHRGSYTGQFGFVLIEPANNPGDYDKEVFLALREWEPYFLPESEEDEDEEAAPGPQPERPAVLDTSPPGSRWDTRGSLLTTRP